MIPFERAVLMRFCACESEARKILRALRIYRTMPDESRQNFQPKLRVRSEDGRNKDSWRLHFAYWLCRTAYESPAYVFYMPIIAFVLYGSVLVWWASSFFRG